MTATSRAAVLISPNVLEIKEFALPKIQRDDGLLRMDACGVCGTDYSHYFGTMGGGKRLNPWKWDVILPFILGHEPVGFIEEIGPDASKRWDVKKGDRVVVHAHYTCGRCNGCNIGGKCEFPGRYGGTQTERPPALFGAFADYLYLPPGVNVTKISKKVPSHIAAMFNSLASGFNWAVETPELEKGQSLAVLGPGQRGLASVMAGRYSGASFVAVTGMPSDDYKMALAKKLGADLAIDVTKEDPVAKVRDATKGDGIDVVVDTTPYSAQATMQGMEMLKPGGTLIIAGVKGPGNTVKDFSIDNMRSRSIWIRGVTAVPPASQKRAVDLIEAGTFPLDMLSSHVFELKDTEQALLTLAGRITGEKPLNIAIVPGKRS
jgi:threonine dehydrogenase-like Zn-dependent dehydrogenase